MNKLSFAVVMFSSSLVLAQGAPAGSKPAGDTKAPAAAGAPGSADEMAKMMAMSKPGPNQEALKPFAKNATFTGTHMSPDGKEMPTKGKQNCKWIDGGMWVTCDIDQTAGTGKTAMHWMGHLVFGWDNMTNGYRAFITDNYGMSSRMKGTLEGDKMVWESMDEMKGPPGMPTKERVTDDGKTMTFEGMMNGKWTPMGTATLKAAGGK